MNTMKCFECVLKHLATALSYGKEIMSGHGQGSDLDHRIDFLGELTNLEHHLELIDQMLFIEVKNYREQLQAKKIAVDESDLQYIRELFAKVENIQSASPKNEKIVTEITSIPDILFLHIRDKAYFDLCYRQLKENLIDYGKIYCLESDIDLTGYEVEKIDYKDIDSAYLFILNENCIPLRQISCKALLRIQDYNNKIKMGDIIQQVKKNQPYYYYDNFPAVVEKSLFWDCLNSDYPLTLYCNQHKAEMQYKPFQLALKLDKVLCCSNKQRIRTAMYVYLENETARKSVIDYLDNKNKNNIQK